MPGEDENQAWSVCVFFLAGIQTGIGHEGSS